MLKWIRKAMQKQEGFTLIELIVVVAIIAILAFTITPRVLQALDNSRTSSARSFANELHSSMERFFANEGTAGTANYPNPSATSFTALRTELEDTVGLSTKDTNIVTGFAYTSYSDSPPAAGNKIATYSATGDDAVQGYCIHFAAKDKTATEFRITPAGVEEDDTTAIPCP